MSVFPGLAVDSSNEACEALAFFAPLKARRFYALPSSYLYLEGLGY